MKIHEYQAKQLLAKKRIPVPPHKVVRTVADIPKSPDEIFPQPWVIKAQIHAGGRGKAGGIQVANTLEELSEKSRSLLGKKLVTYQTVPDGKIVRTLLIEPQIKIEKELYLGLVIDRREEKVTVLLSSEGGVEIEEVARKNPERIFRYGVDVSHGFVAEDFSSRLRLSPLHESFDKIAKPLVSIIKALYETFWEYDCSLVEINPLILTRDKKLIALDAKINFDDNALFRHPDIAALRDLEEEDPLEVEASKHGLNYISLNGNIGCLVNGAGLAMATMDMIKLAGAEPANFLDVGGGATQENVIEAFKILFSDTKVKGVLVNIFGGIMSCDVIARGIIEAAHRIPHNTPLVVRLDGTHVKEGYEILSNSKLKIISAQSMEDAATKVVAAITKGTENPTHKLRC